MTIEPAPPEEKGWTQVKTTPKRGNQNEKETDKVTMSIDSEKWRAEFVVNRSDRGKQWLIDVALTNLLRPFFQQNKDTKIICEDNTVITATEDIKKQINKKLNNVVQTTETNDRKIVVFNIHYPPGLTEAKRNKSLMNHLKESKVFLNQHTCTSLTFAQVGFLIELDPNTTFRPEIHDRIQAALKQHLMAHPNDGKNAFEPIESTATVPYLELRKGIEMIQYKSDEEDGTKITVKTEVIQIWTETPQAEKLRSLLSKADLEQKSVGQFIPKQRGVHLFSKEKYVNAINRQNKYISETSTIMVQCIATEAMSAGIQPVVPNEPMRALDEHILSIEHVKRIEQTNDTDTKGKWLIVCENKERENIREILIQHIGEVYMRSTAYEDVKDMFYSPVPIVAPPRYDYETYVERIIPEKMVINEDTKTSYNQKSYTKRPPTTITTTHNQAEKTRSSPYLEAVKRAEQRREHSSPLTETTQETRSKASTTSIGVEGVSRNNESALSALTSKVDSLTSKLTAATKEIESAKKIITELRQENTELKAMHNKTEMMFQQMMMSHQQLLQSITPILNQYNNNPTSTPAISSNLNTTSANTDNNNFQSARTSLSTAARSQRPLREPPDIRPTNLLQRINETMPVLNAQDGDREIVFIRDSEEDLNHMSDAYFDDINSNNNTSPSSRLEDEY